MKKTPIPPLQILSLPRQTSLSKLSWLKEWEKRNRILRKCIIIRWKRKTFNLLILFCLLFHFSKIILWKSFCFPFGFIRFYDRMSYCYRADDMTQTGKQLVLGLIGENELVSSLILSSNYWGVSWILEACRWGILTHLEVGTEIGLPEKNS